MPINLQPKGPKAECGRKKVEKVEAKKHTTGSIHVKNEHN